MSMSRGELNETLKRAQDAFERGDADEALRLVTLAAEFYPDHPQVLSDMGALLGSSGLFEQAETFFRRAIAKDPGLEDAYLNLARIQIHGGAIEDARRTFSEYCRLGIEGDPDAREIEALLAQAPRSRSGAPVHPGSLEQATVRWPEQVAAHEIACTFFESGSRVLVVGELASVGASRARDIRAEVICHESPSYDDLVDDSFDVVVFVGSGLGEASNVSVVAEWRRILREGGLLITAGPHDSNASTLEVEESFSLVETRAQAGGASFSREVAPGDGRWTFTVWRALVGASVTTPPPFVPDVQNEQPAALFVDWRRGAGEAHRHLRQAFAGLGYRVLEPTMAELEEETRGVELGSEGTDLDLHRVVEAARIREYGTEGAPEEVSREQIRSRFERIDSMLRCAVDKYAPSVVVTSGQGWIESWAAQQVARDKDLCLLCVDGIAPNRCTLSLSEGRVESGGHSLRKRFEWTRFRLSSEFDRTATLSRLLDPESSESGSDEAFLRDLNVEASSSVAVLAVDAEGTWLGSPGTTPFESVWQVIERTVATVTARNGWRLIIWCREPDLDGSGRDPLTVLKERGCLDRGVAAVVGRDPRMERLAERTSCALATSFDAAIPFLARGCPTVSLVSGHWTGLGFTRDVTRLTTFDAVVTEALDDPRMSEDERRLSDLFLQEFSEEELVSIDYESIRDALAERLADLGRLVRPSLASPSTMPAEVSSEPKTIVPAVTSASGFVLPQLRFGEPTLEMSVIIPSYGRPHILRSLLDNLARQTLDPSRFEVVVTDDGTEPPLHEALEGYQAPYELTIKRQNNRGHGAARNHAIGFARGRYLMILNDDAVPGPQLLERHLQAQLASPVPRAYLGRFDFDEENTTPLSTALTEARMLFPVECMDATGPNPGRYFWTCNISVPRESVLTVGGFDETFNVMSEDVELGHRLEKIGVHIFFLQGGDCGHHHRIDVDWFEKRQLNLGHEMVRLFKKHGEEALYPGWKPTGSLEEWTVALDAEIRASGGRLSNYVNQMRALDSWSQVGAIRADGMSERDALVRYLRTASELVSRNSIMIGILAGLKNMEVWDLLPEFSNPLPRTTLVIPIDPQDKEAVNAIRTLRHRAGTCVELIALVGPQLERIIDPLQGLYQARTLQVGESETLEELRTRVLGYVNGEYVAFLSTLYDFDPNWLKSLVEALERDPGAGAAGPYIEGEESSYTVDNGVITRLHGGVVLTRTEAVTQTLKPEEGKDFQDRLRSRGFTLLYVPESRVARKDLPAMAAAMASGASLSL